MTSLGEIHHVVDDALPGRSSLWTSPRLRRGAYGNLQKENLGTCQYETVVRDSVVSLCATTPHLRGRRHVRKGAFCARKAFLLGESSGSGFDFGMGGGQNLQG